MSGRWLAEHLALVRLQQRANVDQFCWIVHGVKRDEARAPVRLFALGGAPGERGVWRVGHDSWTVTVTMRRVPHATVTTSSGRTREAAASKADKIRALEEQRQQWFAQREEVLAAAPRSAGSAPSSRTSTLPPVTRVPPERESVSQDRGLGRSDSFPSRLPSSAPAIAAGAGSAGAVSDDVLHKVRCVDRNV
jgi:hypothetical protein